MRISSSWRKKVVTLSVRLPVQLLKYRRSRLLLWPRVRQRTPRRIYSSVVMWSDTQASNKPIMNRDNTRLQRVSDHFSRSYESISTLRYSACLTVTSSMTTSVNSKRSRRRMRSCSTSRTWKRLRVWLSNLNMSPGFSALSLLLLMASWMKCTGFRSLELQKKLGLFSSM